MRERYHLPQAALNTIMWWTTAINQDSVTLAGQRVKRKLENRTPSVTCDISDCLDLADHDPFQDCHSAMSTRCRYYNTQGDCRHFCYTHQLPHIQHSPG